MTDKYVNPLELVASDSTDKNLESTSALENDTHGTCPKCKSPMRQDAVIASGEDVYYCEKCRVTSPKQDLNL